MSTNTALTDIDANGVIDVLKDVLVTASNGGLVRSGLINLTWMGIGAVAGRPLLNWSGRKLKDIVNSNSKTTQSKNVRDVNAQLRRLEAVNNA